MGNRAYLIKTSKEKSEELFESNNTIPLFWFTFLDFDTIEKFGKNLIDYYNHCCDSDNNKEEIEAVNIKIPKQTFIKNAIAGKQFIEENYPDKVDLYNDFLKYLDSKFNETDLLELNIFEIGNFDGMENLVGEIKNIVKNIKENINKIHPFTPDESVYSYVGGDDFLENQFREYSADYLEYGLNEERKLRDKESVKHQSNTKVKEKFKNIFMCIGGIAFVGASILGIVIGDYFMGIVGIIFGGIALLFGVLNLKG